MENSALIHKHDKQSSSKQTILNVLLVAGVIASLVLGILLATGNIKPKSSETHNNYNSFNYSYYSMMQPYRKTNISTVQEFPGIGFASIRSVIGSDGLPVLFFHRQTVNIMQFIKCNDVSCTSSKPAKTINGTYGSVVLAQPVVGSDGFIFTVAQVFNVATYNSTFVAVHCGDLDCNSITVTSLDTNAGYNAKVLIEADGNPLITYFKEGRVVIRHCLDTACDNSEYGMVFTSGFTGVDSAIGLDGNVLLLLTAQNGSLSTLHCTSNFNYQCIDFDYNVIGYAGNSSAQLFVGVTGDIHVVIPGSVLTCSNVQCSDVYSTDIPTTNNNVNNMIAVTIDRTGLPLIVEPNLTNVSIIACMTEDCKSYSYRVDASLVPQQMFAQVTMVTGTNGFPFITFVSYSAQNGSVSLFVVACDNHLCTPWKN